MQKLQCAIHNGTFKSFYCKLSVIWILMFIILKTNYFQFWVSCAFLVQKNKKELSELNTFKQIKPAKFRYKSDKVFKVTVVNRALPSLHGGSLEITLTVPLIYIYPWFHDVPVNWMWRVDWIQPLHMYTSRQSIISEKYQHTDSSLYSGRRNLTYGSLYWTHIWKLQTSWLKLQSFCSKLRTCYSKLGTFSSKLWTIRLKRGIFCSKLGTLIVRN